MIHAEYSTALKRAKFWADMMYGVTTMSLMLLLFSIGYVWFAEIQKMTLIFRNLTKPVGDDGFYGAMMGILIGVTSDDSTVRGNSGLERYRPTEQQCACVG